MNFELIYVSSLLLGICLANQADAVPSDCNLPADAGMCYAYFPMFFYDASSSKCLNFIYGGCGGNANRFWSEAECMEKCGGGGGGSGGDDLSPADVCQLEKFKGPCDAFRMRYYFNKDTGKCEKFLFSGCRSNGNNFRTEKECEETCVRRSQKTAKMLSATNADVCDQDKQLGHCSSQINRYYFDKDSRKCERFQYTGCGGNDNNFNYLFECERTCPGDLDLGDICSLEKKVGPCKAHMPRYYFNRETGLCEQFIYGGCSGNHNNFQTKEQCESFCAPGNSPSS